LLPLGQKVGKVGEKENPPTRCLLARNMGTSSGVAPAGGAHQNLTQATGTGQPPLPLGGCPGLGSEWARRLPRPGHPGQRRRRWRRRRTTTSATRGGLSTGRAPPCRRTSSPTPTSAPTSSTSSTAASSYVPLLPLPHHTTIPPVLLLHPAACDPHCGSGSASAPAMAPGNFRDPARLLSSLRSTRTRIPLASFLGHTKSIKKKGISEPYPFCDCTP
jgi:hypothetical protein